MPIHKFITLRMGTSAISHDSFIKIIKNNFFQQSTFNQAQLFAILQGMNSQIKTDALLKEGLTAGWPICLGYLPIGIALGVLAQKAGLSPLAVGLMSMFVFAGSSQFIAVSMLAGGATFVAIIVTTFMVNLRHLLMSSSLSVFLNGSRKGLLFLFAYGLTDESFAVNYVRFKEGGWDLKRALVVNHVANFTWIAIGSWRLQRAIYPYRGLWH